MDCQECGVGLGSGGCHDGEGGRGDCEDCHGASSGEEGDDDATLGVADAGCC